MEDTRDDIAPEQAVALENAEQAIEAVQHEVSERDDKILAELKNIHIAIMGQTEHYVKHLESHTLTSQAPVQQVASHISEPEDSLPVEPVHLTMNEPHDISQPDTTKPKKRNKPFGKKRK